MNIRGGADGDTTWHAADVCQCWQLDDIVAIPLPLIPAWIRRSLLGRSTYGRIRPSDLLGNPHHIMEQLIDGNPFAERGWTLDIAEIRRRMLCDIGPQTFEHLIVALLQLEHPDEIWSQIGGSGDGGIDGIGSTQNGQVTGLLQCKWHYTGGNPFAVDVVWPEGQMPFIKILASLQHPLAIDIEGVTFLGADEIANLVAKHHPRLPWAAAMRIGHLPAV